MRAWSLALMSLILMSACEQADKKTTTSSTGPSNGTGTGSSTTPNAGSGSGTPSTPPPAHISKGWPPYTCPTYSAATATTEQEAELKALKSVKIGDTLETMPSEVKTLLSNSSKTSTRTDVPVEGCSTTLVYNFEAEQYEDSGTATAFSFRFWLCDGVVDKINFCPGIDGK